MPSQNWPLVDTHLHHRVFGGGERRRERGGEGKENIKKRCSQGPEKARVIGTLYHPRAGENHLDDQVNNKSKHQAVSETEDQSNGKARETRRPEEGLDQNLLSFHLTHQSKEWLLDRQLVLRLRDWAISRIFPQRHGKGPSHKKDNNLSAKKGKGHSKKKEQKAHHIGQQHQQLKLTAGFKQKIGEPEKGSETAIVVNRSKAREREVSDAKGNSSMKASVVITRSSCLIDSPSIIQSRKQSQRPLEKDDFYFKILSWIVKKPKGKKEKQRQRRCLLHGDAEIAFQEPLGGRSIQFHDTQGAGRRPAAAQLFERNAVVLVPIDKGRMPGRRSSTVGPIRIPPLFPFPSAPFPRNEKEDGTLELYYLSAYCLPKILLLQLVGHRVIQISRVFRGFPMLQLPYQFGRSGMDRLNIPLGSLVLTFLCGIHSRSALGITSSSGGNSSQNPTTSPTSLPLTLSRTSIETEWFHVLSPIGYSFPFVSLSPISVSISSQD
ncbi:cytochrome c maturase subunit B [Tanacetum coccineum]|uniref:Cytochrome c maturase subunit B n=1 Tax=Tanacetum coccineum TaxID=301880 RepID=A0ABQ4XJH0_9ASTR